MILDKLNPAQRKAAEIIQGPLLILAGAGSGKTNTIVHRIVHMIQNHAISPENILAISFTNKASSELKDRINKLVKRENRKVQTGTFHALCLKILKKECEHLGFYYPFSICGPGDQLSILNELAKNYKHVSKGKFDKKKLLSMISKLKNIGVDEHEYPHHYLYDPDDDYCHICQYFYPLYQERLHELNAFDFDDLLFKTVTILEKNQTIAQNYSQLFKYIVVDEYQDTNDLQFRLIKALTCTHQNICVVGDDDQAIYGFRGANIKNILNFEHLYKDTQVVFLEQNYRSTSPILNLANEVIKENKNRKDKKLWSTNESDQKPILHQVKDPSHEALYIIEKIDQLNKAGHAFKDMAILCRSIQQTSLLEGELRTFHIPYKIIGGQKIFEKKEVKDIMAYLLLTANNRDELSLRRIINTPTRGIGATSTKKIIDIARSKKLTVFDLIHKNLVSKEELGRIELIKDFIHMIQSFREFNQQSSISETIEHVIEKINYHEFIDHYYHDAAGKKDLKKNDLKHLVQLAKHFENKNPTLKLRDFLEQMQLADQSTTKKSEEFTQDLVTIMTLHASKGLEFETVFMMGVEEELLPHKRSIEESGVDEERRLFYVGVTRAKKNLFMSHCLERTMYEKQQKRHISRFLNQKEDFYQKNCLLADLEKKEQEKKAKQSQFFSDLSSFLD
jgi:ATP-dependent DNA helicase Rep/DNA helicase-2/ATP-dependent DNA helicase PcrA